MSEAHAMTASRRTIARSVSIWALILSVLCVGRMTAATDAQCRDILRQALDAKNAETRKQAVVALTRTKPCDSALRRRI